MAVKKPSYKTLETALKQFAEAFEVHLGERAPGKCIETGDWVSGSYRVLFRKDYPHLHRALEWVLAEEVLKTEEPIWG